MLNNNQIELEQEILGSMLKNNSLILKAKDTIKPEMFLYDKHINIYLGILEMVSNKLEIDLITFLEYHKAQLRNMDGWILYFRNIYRKCK